MKKRSLGATGSFSARVPRGVFVSLGFCLMALTAAAQDAPPLPPGLAPPAKESSPPLPPGLGAPAKKPAADEAPPLPPGLGGPTETPPEDAAPPLPPGLSTAPPEKPADTEKAEGGRKSEFPLDLHGFWELRGGMRLQEDDTQPKDAILGEARLQLQWEKAWKKVQFELTTDFVADAIIEDADPDVRQVRLTWTPVDFLDLRIGRQVLTWGTGDLIFINDLFPKDWQSFLSGRDVEYLKAPSDAVRVGLYNQFVNIDFVYTPQFDADRFITGERISFYSPLAGGRAGHASQVAFDAPNDWFSEDEFALRLYRNVGGFEAALYGYSGYWKSPGGQRLIPMRAIFPKLRVYGASLRGAIGKGVANAEIGYLDSYQDSDGSDPFINNSEFRFLIGYERELAKEFTASVQYYLEHMIDYGAYRDTLPFFMKPRDRDRHVFTLRLTKLAMNQNMTLSLFAFYSPSDNDAYLRPRVQYKATDAWRLEAGANIFFGEDDHTFFAQFEDNTNIYAAVRYSF